MSDWPAPDPGIAEAMRLMPDHIKVQLLSELVARASEFPSDDDEPEVIRDEC